MILRRIKNCLSVLCLLLVMLFVSSCQNSDAECAHDWSEWMIKTEATCENEGAQMRACKKCSKTDIEKIEPLGHTYEENWVWNESQDGYTASLNLVCLNNPNHKIEKSATVSSEIVEASCSKDGAIRYTATVKLGNEEYTDVKDIITGKLEHSFSNIWSSNENEHWQECECGEKSSVASHSLGELNEETQSKICSICNYVKHIHSYTIETIDDKYLKSAADCLNAAVYYKSCVCGEYGSAVFEKLNSELGHDFGEDGICTRCKEERMQISYNLEFVLSANGTYYIVNGIGTETKSKFEIPSIYNDKPVKEIAQSAFANNIVTEVSIPSSITTFGNGAFNKLLKSVNYNGTIQEWCSISFGYSNNPLARGAKLYFNNELFTELVLTDENITKIGDSAFQGCTSLEKVVLSDKVKSVGSYAFFQCSNLKVLEIGNGVTTTDSFAFAYCSSLTTVSLGNTISKIGYCGFSACSALENIEIPANVTEIVDGAFSNCSSLVEVVIPDKITSINSTTFSKCSNLQTVKLGKSVKSIADNAFTSCSMLKEFQIGENTYFAVLDGVLYDAAKTTLIQYPLGKEVNEFAIPDGVQTIGKNAFRESELSAISLPETVKAINADAFSYCKNLLSIHIPASITTIDPAAFSYCTSLLEITVDENNNSYCSVDGNLYSKDKTVLCQYALGKKATSFEIPETVTTIANSAFKGCVNLSSVIVYENTTTYNGLPFLDCFKLVEVINKGSFDWNAGDETGDNGYITKYALIVNNAESNLYILNDYVFLLFDGNYYLLNYIGKETSIVLPESFDGHSYYLYDYAFYNNKDIVNIVLPDSLLGIGEYVFEGCDKLSTTLFDNALYVGSANNPYMCLLSAQSEDISQCTLHPNTRFVHTAAFDYCTKLSNIKFNEKLESIGRDAFLRCYALVNPAFPNSLNKIGLQAFYECIGITEIVIPNSVTEMDKYVFDGCILLRTVTLGNGLTKIPESAFYGCMSLEKVVFGNNLKEIGAYAFKNCDSLKDIVIPEGVTQIGYSSFADCSKLENISIPSSITSVPRSFLLGSNNIKYTEYENAYYLGNESNPYLILVKAKNTNISNCKVHDDTRYISSYAFRDCTALSSITLGAGVTYIGEQAFSSCTGLKNIVIPAQVTYIGQSAFWKSSVTNVTFNNKVGWEIYSGWTGTYVKTFESSELNDTSANAKYLKNNYQNIWVKNLSNEQEVE